MAFSDVPAHDRITRLEEMIREFAHMGQAGLRLQAMVVQEFFSDLSEDLKQTLLDSILKECTLVWLDQRWQERRKRLTQPRTM